jgi:enoyl-CoA hydratase
MPIDHDVPAAAGIARRDLILAGAAVVAAVGLGGAPALAQNAPLAPGKVAVERRGAIQLIGIDRAQFQNRLDPATLVGIGKAYYELDHDDALRVAVLYGIGPDFCVGSDVAALAAAFADGSYPPKDPDYINPYQFGPQLRTKPVVVAAHGGTKFGGHELFLACDIRVAASDTVFGQAEVTRGVFPGAGGAIRMTREAGWGNAMLHMLTGEEWTAEEGYRLGLVQAVTPPGKQLDRALELAAKIAAAAPLGVRATLASARQATSSEEAAFATLRSDFRQILQSEDVKEARRAIAEQRAPVFKGI